MREDCTFFAPLTVRYQEVDQQGVVWNGHYADYMEVAYAAYYKHMGRSYKEMSLKGESEIAYRKVTYEYFNALYDEDEVEVGVRVLHIGNKSFTMGYEFYRKGEDELLGSIEAVAVCIDKDTRTSRPIAKKLRDMLEETVAEQEKL